MVTVATRPRPYSQDPPAFRNRHYGRRMTQGHPDPTDDAEPSPPVTADDLVSDRALTAVGDDQFRHQAIADRVADLVRVATVPLNVALFGAWGSGKSSIAGFLKENLEEGDAVSFVYYDAWKYGGESLRRNFISRAATDLKLLRDEVSNESFYRGLYQTTRRVRLRDSSVRRGLRLGFALLLIVFLALNALTIVGVGALAVVSDVDFSKDTAAVLSKSLAGSGLAAIAAALATAFAALAKIDIEQSAPSADEEFSDTFKHLIETVRRGPAPRPSALWGWTKRRPATPQEVAQTGPDRIVFFIDELDRCTEEDVVKTLVAIRTFLDEKHCVFVVAADRAVLETALDKAAEQATPTREDAPYYSTAGAFLDKVFQHQLNIPPLRPRRLTRFARDQVAEKNAGIWKELRDDQLLDDVIFALVPAHVQSPRRIKVLLNNFAINARTAQARGVAWPSRAEEIAKLTVLQTEYPALADDLHIEPRLPELLLDALAGDDQSERAEGLVRRHSLSGGTSKPGQQDATPFMDGEQPAADSEDATASAYHEEMRRQQRKELRRYLERTADIEGPHRDLLYLEAAGEAVDLRDPVLGDRIEDAAPDRPDEVRDLLAEADTSVRLGAARLLASMLDDLVRKERANVMTALTTLTAELGHQLPGDVASALAKSMRVFERQDEFAPSHLPGLLEVGLRARDEELSESVLQNDALWSDASQVEAVAMRWGELPEAGQQRLEEELARNLRDEPSVIGAPLSALPEARALEVLGSATIRTAIGTAYDEHIEQLDALTRQLLDAPLAQRIPRATQLDRTVAILRASHEPTYQLLHNRRQEISPALALAERNSWILKMWAAGPVADWGVWAPMLSPQITGGASQEADTALEQLFSRWPEVPLDSEEAVLEHARSISGFAEFPDDEIAGFATHLEAALTNRWGANEDDIRSRENLHRAARETFAIGGSTAAQVELLLVGDLTAQMDEGGIGAAFYALERMAKPLSTVSILDVAEHLRQHDAESEPEEAVRELTARAALALEVKERGGHEWRGQELEIRYNEELRHVCLKPEAKNLVTRWLRLDATVAQVRIVLKRYTRISAGLRDAIKYWSAAQAKSDRTSVVTTLLKLPSPNGPVIAALTTSDVTQKKLARELALLATTQPSARERQQFAEKTSFLGLESAAARQLIADAALDRLSSGVRGDIAVAVALVTGLSDTPPRQPALRQAFNKAAEKHTYKFSRSEASALVDSGIKPRKESVGEKIRKALSL